MKLTLKHQLSRLGLLPYLDILRRMPEISRWLKHGCTGIAPPPRKKMGNCSVLAALLDHTVH